MKAFMTSLLFLALFGIRAPALFAQPDQSYQELAQEVEVLKSQLSALQNQLQTVENIEKMDLSAKLADANAKLADANAKLMNAEFGRFERELRDSNNNWLWGWTAFFGVIFTVILGVIGLALWFVIKSLIKDRVEEVLNGFKEAVGQLNEIKDQLKVLQTGHALSVLAHFRYYHRDEEPYFREQTKSIPEDALLQVFGDETRDLALRFRAVDVLAYRKSPRFVAPLLELMDSIVDNSGYSYHDIDDWGDELIKSLGQICTQESYQGLKEFLNRSRIEDSTYKHLFLTPTVFTLAKLSIELEKRDSIAILRKSIPDLRVDSHEEDDLTNLAEYFDTFDESEGIKEILNRVKDEIPNVAHRCLELLEKYDPKFVSDWREQNAEANTETEETS